MNNKAYEKERERINDLRDQIKQYVSIVDVVTNAGIHLSPSGGNYYQGPCPWHDEKSVGAFKVHETKGCRCFGCADRWMDSIEFVRKHYGLDYVSAIEKIASDFGLISTLDVDYKPVNQRKVSVVPKTKKAAKHSDEKLNEIHSLFLESCSLSDKHRTYLKEERGLSDEEIEKFNFKTYPSRHIMMKNPPNGITSFVKKLQDRGIKSYELIGSPIFYKELLNDPTKNDKITFRRMAGLILPILNAEQEIVGLQIRKDSGNVRYIWVSSGSFADGVYNSQYINGTDSGAPMDIMYPEQLRRNVLFITEGKFKAIAIQKKYGVPVISVQGVSNWNGINKVIEGMEKRLNIKFERICIAFDADCAVKPQVLHQLIMMSKEIQSQFDIEISTLIWDMKVGKGIDDYFQNNGKTRDIIFLSQETLHEKINYFLKDEKIKEKHQLSKFANQDITLLNVDSDLFQKKFYKILIQ